MTDDTTGEAASRIGRDRLAIDDDIASPNTAERRRAVGVSPDRTAAGEGPVLTTTGGEGKGDLRSACCCKNRATADVFRCS